MKLKSLSAALAATLVLLASCAPAQSAGTPSQPPSSQPEETGSVGEASSADETPGILSSFTATDLEGNEVTQEVLSGKKLTMVNIWATFCGPCLSEMPELGELAGEYENFQIIGVVIDTLDQKGNLVETQVDTAKEVVEKTKASYLHLLPSADLISVGIASVSSVPTTFFVDESGKQVGSAYMGAKSKDKWAKIIEDTFASLPGEKAA